MKCDESRTKDFHLFRRTEILVRRQRRPRKAAKSLLFTIIKKKDFLGSLDTNPYYLQTFNLSHFTLFYNGKQMPIEGLAMNMAQEKILVLAYNNQFEESGIPHSNAGLQLTHDMFIAEYFMVSFALTPESAASKVHVSIPDRSNIRRTRHLPVLSRVHYNSNKIIVSG